MVRIPKELHEKLKKVAEEVKKPMHKVIEDAMMDKLAEVGSTFEGQMAIATQIAKELEQRGFFDIKIKSAKVTKVTDVENGLVIEGCVSLSVPEDLKPIVKDALKRLGW